MDLAEADAARARIIDIEQRLAEGEPIPSATVSEAHAEYTEAEMWRSEQDTAARRAAQEAQGIVPGPTQGIGLGS